MLKRIRVIAAALLFSFLTLLFLDFTGTLHTLFAWVAKIQFIPALLGLNAGIIIGLLLLTILFGRIYCSVICPLGVYQDIVSHLSGKRKGKKSRFRYSPAKTWLRYSLLVVYIVALIAGISVIVSLFDPYAAYGRMASNLLAPVYRLGNNLLALLAERMDSYAFYSTEVWIKGWLTFGIAVITLLAIGFLAFKNGRTYCNTLCPVGTFLGFASRFSIFKVSFDADKCTQCKVCEKNCKASCIEVKTMQVDHSRCVTCFNCVEKCKFGAMQYVPRFSSANKTNKKETVHSAQLEEKGASRRKTLSLMALFTFAHTVKAQQLKVDGGLATIEDKKVPQRKTPIVPPGSQSLKHFKQHCTACQLCVSACPNNILRPSNKLETLMQPEMSFERGYCRPECTECAKVCPTNAIGGITTAEKSAISIGSAVWIKENCIVNVDEVQCKRCERSCPTGAIVLVARNPEEANSLKIPTVDKELCIGCGACENLCPARPFSAIYVEGHVRHHTI